MPLPALGQDGNVQPKTWSIKGDLLLKKSFMYDESSLNLSSTNYKFSTAFQPLLRFDFDHAIAPRLNLCAGVGIAKSSYKINYDYQTSTAQYSQSFKVGITTYKFHGGIAYVPNSNWYFSGGIVYNLHSHSLRGLSANFSGQDLFAIAYYANSIFETTRGVSSFLYASRSFNRISVSLIADWDWGEYPNAIFTHELTDLNNGQVTQTSASGYPHILFVGVGAGYRLMYTKQNSPRKRLTFDCP